MAQFVLAFIRSDLVFLILILGLFCSLIYNRSFIGKNNELLSLLMLESSKVILFMNSLAYLWDAYLLGSGGPIYYSTAFFFSGFALAFVKAFIVVFTFLVLILAESFFFP